MSNLRVAGRYAKSLTDLAQEMNSLDAVHRDMKYLKSVSGGSREFLNLLRSPVISGTKKQQIIDSVLGSGISDISRGFIRLLINKKRESNLPEIADAVIDRYNKINNIHKIKLTTAEPVSDELANAIVGKVKQEKNLQNVILERSVDSRLIGGFTMQVGEQMIDASILHDLNEVKRQFMNNDYVHNIR